MLENKLTYENLITLAKPIANGFLYDSLQQNPEDFYINGIQVNMKENKHTFSDIKSIHVLDVQPNGFVFRISVGFYSELNMLVPIGFVFVGFSKTKENKDVKDTETVEQR